MSDIAKSMEHEDELRQARAKLLPPAKPEIDLTALAKVYEDNMKMKSILQGNAGEEKKEGQE